MQIALGQQLHEKGLKRLLPHPQLLEDGSRQLWSHPQPELLWAACGNVQAKALRRWMREYQGPVRCQISNYWR
ncbi:hypothetical protein ACMDM8_09060 [Comamonas resistens]